MDRFSPPKTGKTGKGWRGDLGLGASTNILDRPELEGTGRRGDFPKQFEKSNEPASIVTCD
jgi:hypothetical protein